MSKKELALTEQREKFAVAVQEAGEVARMNNDITKSLYMADAVNQLRIVMKSDEISNVLSSMQNSSVGFKTDRQSGYQKEVLVDCAIEALSMGLFLHGNEFNIIGGNCYPAQRGFERLLREYCITHNIKRQFINRIPKFVEQRGKQNVFEVTYDVIWKKPNEEKESTVLKWHLVGMTHDQVIGKAKKRAYQWLYNELSNNSLPLDDEGDFDIEGKVSKPSSILSQVDESEEKASEPVQEAEIIQEEKPEAPQYKTTDEIIKQMTGRCKLAGVSQEVMREKLSECGAIPEGVSVKDMSLEDALKVLEETDKIILELTENKK